MNSHPDVVQHPAERCDSRRTGMAHPMISTAASMRS